MVDYPGTAESAADTIALAEEYRIAALSLLGNSRRGKPLTRAPARLCAIHAVELYLNAYLLSHGWRPESIRGLHHDLGRKTASATALGLHLRKRTALHLQTLTERREYLVVRYAPTSVAHLCEVNRVFATLDEVARKAGARLGKPAPDRPPPEARAGVC